MAGLPCEDFRDRDAFVLGLVRQHRSCDHVADGVDALHIGGEMTVGLHPAAGIEFNAGLFQPEPIGVGDATDTDHHHIGVDGVGGTAGCRLDLRLQHFFPKRRWR